MELALTSPTDLDFDTAVQLTRERLAEQGFGVLTEIDVQATLRAKLDVEVPRYLILGACNPALAHQALDVEPEIGLLLPCNVVVRETPNGVDVQAMNPELLVEVTGRTELAGTAREAAERLHVALAALGTGEQA